MSHVSPEYRLLQRDAKVKKAEDLLVSFFRRAEVIEDGYDEAEVRSIVRLIVEAAEGDG